MVNRVRLINKSKEIRRALIKLYKWGLSGKVHNCVFYKSNIYKGKSIVIRPTYKKRRGIVWVTETTLFSLSLNIDQAII